MCRRAREMLGAHLAGIPRCTHGQLCAHASPFPCSRTCICAEHAHAPCCMNPLAHWAIMRSSQHAPADRHVLRVPCAVQRPVRIAVRTASFRILSDGSATASFMSCSMQSSVACPSGNVSAQQHAECAHGALCARAAESCICMSSPNGRIVHTWAHARQPTLHVADRTCMRVEGGHHGHLNA